jgi:hypothetical protein
MLLATDMPYTQVDCPDMLAEAHLLRDDLIALLRLTNRRDVRPITNAESHSLASKISSEFVVACNGIIDARNAFIDIIHDGVRTNTFDRQSSETAILMLFAFSIADHSERIMQIATKLASNTTHIQDSIVSTMACLNIIIIHDEYTGIGDQNMLPVEVLLIANARRMGYHYAFMQRSCLLYAETCASRDLLHADIDAFKELLTTLKTPDIEGSITTSSMQTFVSKIARDEDIMHETWGIVDFIVRNANVTTKTTAVLTQVLTENPKTMEGIQGADLASLASRLLMPQVTDSSFTTATILYEQALRNNASISPDTVFMFAKTVLHNSYLRVRMRTREAFVCILKAFYVSPSKDHTDKLCTGALNRLCQSTYFFHLGVIQGISSVFDNISPRFYSAAIEFILSSNLMQCLTEASEKIQIEKEEHGDSNPHELSCRMWTKYIIDLMFKLLGSVEVQRKECIPALLVNFIVQSACDIGFRHISMHKFSTIITKLNSIGHITPQHSRFIISNICDGARCKEIDGANAVAATRLVSLACEMRVCENDANASHEIGTLFSEMCNRFANAPRIILSMMCVAKTIMDTNALLITPDIARCFATIASTVILSKQAKCAQGVPIALHLFTNCHFYNHEIVAHAMLTSEFLEAVQQHINLNIPSAASKQAQILRLILLDAV